MLAGQIESQGGTVLLDNRDITFAESAERGFGFVHQNYALFLHLSVLENAAFSLDAEKLSAAEIKARSPRPTPPRAPARRSSSASVPNA